jgi:hypothetical protein
VLHHPTEHLIIFIIDTVAPLNFIAKAGDLNTLPLLLGAHPLDFIVNPCPLLIFMKLTGFMAMVPLFMVQVSTFSFIMVQVSTFSLIITKNLHIINIQPIFFHLGGSPRWVRQ